MSERTKFLNKLIIARRSEVSLNFRFYANGLWVLMTDRNCLNEHVGSNI